MILSWIPLRMRNFQTKVVETIKTHILCSITLFLKKWSLWDKVEKCCTARQATDDNTIQCRKDAICMLDNEEMNTDTHSYFILINVDSSKKYFVARHWEGNPQLHFHGNTKHSYIVDSYIKTNKNKKEMHCIHGNNGYVNTPHNVTL